MTTERARLALMVIGPERRDRLITRYADRLSLTYGMTAESARRYTEGLADDADPAVLLAVGQTWSQPDGKILPGGELFGFAAAGSYTIVGFTGDGMVSVGDGTVHLGAHLFRGMWLTSWPDTFTLEDEPEPPQQPIAEQPDKPTEGEPDFDPRVLWVMAHRSREDGLPIGEGLPLLGDHYRAVNWRKPEYEPSFGNALDVPAYLEEHLADYRAGWPDFQNEFAGGDWLDYFNHLGACETDLAVAAYLGRWLWQRVRSDVVTEHGGTVNDYDVMFPWAPCYADLVLEVAQYAHPEWEIPADHRLAQCDGQADLFELMGES